jgi:hypothetical protein
MEGKLEKLMVFSAIYTAGRSAPSEGNANMPLLIPFITAHQQCASVAHRLEMESGAHRDQGGVWYRARR